MNTRFKTIVGRTAYSDEFDTLMDKTVKDLVSEGNHIKDVHLAIADRQIVCIFEYVETHVEEPVAKKKARRKSGKGKTVELEEAIEETLNEQGTAATA